MPCGTLSALEVCSLLCFDIPNDSIFEITSDLSYVVSVDRLLVLFLGKAPPSNCRRGRDMELPFNRIRNILLQLSVFILLNSGQICGSEEIQPATVIAFGSCNRQNKPQDHWNIIRATNPDLFLWTGNVNILESSSSYFFCVQEVQRLLIALIINIINYT